MAVVVGSCSGLGGCDEAPFEEGQTLGGREVSADVLNRGYRVYRYNCLACHGESGDGDGPSARASDPRPRDFRRGQFKFKSTPGDGLPQDADLVRTIERGLDGTTMNAFDLGAEDTDAVVQYLKTFSGRWREETAPAAVVVAPDPWRGRREAGIARGQAVYHGEAVCWRCHPAYLAPQALESLVAVSWSSAAGGRDALASAWRADLGRAVAVESAYGKLLPPDFYGATLRAARTGADLYRTIAAGVGGTEMPAWSETLPPDDVWALVYYVRELQRLGDLRRPRGR